MQLPEYVYEVLQKLNNNGYEAYCVGGCVRDYLLGQCPEDYDVTTSALPEQIIEVFDGYRLLKVGLKHGTVTVIINKHPVEITTYRIDGEYTDHRHPSKVGFTPNLSDDLARRDLTINAIAYNDKVGMVDLYGGAEDLKNGIIRCVGDPMKRFDEDGLRILRALRFASRYGFSIDKETSDAIHRQKFLLSFISAERINSELCGILTGDCYDILRNYSDVICEIIPEMYPCIGFEQHSKYHDKTVYGHIAATVAAAKPTVEARLTMLLHDIGKPDSFFMKDGAGHNALRVQVVLVVAALGDGVHVGLGEQLVVQAHLGVHGMGGTHPVDGALDLASVGRIAVAGLKVGGAVDGRNAAVGILLHALALDDVCAHQTHLTAHGQAL